MLQQYKYLFYFCVFMIGFNTLKFRDKDNYYLYKYNTTIKVPVPVPVPSFIF